MASASRFAKGICARCACHVYVTVVTTEPYVLGLAETGEEQLLRSASVISWHRGFSFPPGRFQDCCEDSLRSCLLVSTTWLFVSPSTFVLFFSMNSRD